MIIGIPVDGVNTCSSLKVALGFPIICNQSLLLRRSKASFFTLVGRLSQSVVLVLLTLFTSTKVEPKYT